MMNARPLVIVTTRLPPAVCGIGTYSWLLQQHWPDSAREVRYFVVDGSTASSRDLNLSGIAEFGLDPRRLARLLAEVGPADVLLHYAGRAYHHFGCPRWLPGVLAAWKKQTPGGHLAILFHELPGKFPITTRHYWIDLCNGRVIRQLARSADVLITNTSEHARKLEQLTGRSPIDWFPVASNIAMSSEEVPPREPGEFVIFGLPFGRWQTLQIFDEHISQWMKTGLLRKLHIIGPPEERFDARSEELIARWSQPGLVVRHGILSAADISKVLARVQFGLANASAENWSKSAVFMAFASHGCAIVMRDRSGSVPLGLTVAPEEVGTIGAADLRERTRALREWYETHAGWDVIAGKIANLIGKMEETAK